MNMSRKINIIFVTIITLFIFNINVSAMGESTTWDSSTNKKYCDSITIKEECLRDGTCIWDANKNSCKAANIASRPCDEPDIRRVLNIFGYILLIAKVAIPLLIIGFATFDLFKSVTDKDEKSLGKQVRMVLIRVLIGMFVFFIPNLVNAIFTLSDRLNVIEGEQYQACATCILNPSACDFEE